VKRDRVFYLLLAHAPFPGLIERAAIDGYRITREIGKAAAREA
jgi:hypothetical protein